MTNGGPAFPVTGEHVQHGMTIRDWFAGMALQGLLAHSCKNDLPIWKATDAAVRAYEMADALLAERTRKEAT